MGRDQRWVAGSGRARTWRRQKLDLELWDVVWRMWEIISWGRDHRVVGGGLAREGKFGGRWMRSWEGLYVGETSKLLGCGWRDLELRTSTRLVAFRDYYTSLTGTRPSNRLDHSPDLVRLNFTPFSLL